MFVSRLHAKWISKLQLEFPDVSFSPHSSFDDRSPVVSVDIVLAQGSFSWWNCCQQLLTGFPWVLCSLHADSFDFLDMLSGSPWHALHLSHLSFGGTLYSEWVFLTNFWTPVWDDLLKAAQAYSRSIRHSVNAATCTV